MKQAKIAPVIVERGGKAEVVVLSKKAYDQLIAAKENPTSEEESKIYIHIRAELAGRTLPDPAEIIRQGRKNAMSNSATVCIDASVVLRYVLMPDDAPIKKVWQAWVSNETNLVAPSLLFYEVTNGLYQQERNKYLSPETIWKSLEYSLDLPITLVNKKIYTCVPERLPYSTTSLPHMMRTISPLPNGWTLNSGQRI